MRLLSRLNHEAVAKTSGPCEWCNRQTQRGRCRRWRYDATRSLVELDPLAVGASDQWVVQPRELGTFCLGRWRVGGRFSNFMLRRRQCAGLLQKGWGLAFGDRSFYRAVSTGGRLPVEVEERMAKRGTSQVQATGILFILGETARAPEWPRFCVHRGRGRMAQDQVVPVLSESHCKWC